MQFHIEEGVPFFFVFSNGVVGNADRDGQARIRDRTVTW